MPFGIARAGVPAHPLPQQPEEPPDPDVPATQDQIKEFINSTFQGAGVFQEWGMCRLQSWSNISQKWTRTEQPRTAGVWHPRDQSILDHVRSQTTIGEFIVRVSGASLHDDQTGTANSQGNDVSGQFSTLLESINQIPHVTACKVFKGEEGHAKPIRVCLFVISYDKNFLPAVPAIGQSVLDLLQFSFVGGVKAQLDFPRGCLALQSVPKHSHFFLHAVQNACLPHLLGAWNTAIKGKQLPLDEQAANALVSRVRNSFGAMQQQLVATIQRFTQFQPLSLVTNPPRRVRAPRDTQNPTGSRPFVQNAWRTGPPNIPATIRHATLGGTIEIPAIPAAPESTDSMNLVQLRAALAASLRREAKEKLLQAEIFERLTIADSASGAGGTGAGTNGEHGGDRGDGGGEGDDSGEGQGGGGAGDGGAGEDKAGGDGGRGGGGGGGSDGAGGASEGEANGDGDDAPPPGPQGEGADDDDRKDDSSSDIDGDDESMGSDEHDDVEPHDKASTDTPGTPRRSTPRSVTRRRNRPFAARRGRGGLPRRMNRETAFNLSRKERPPRGRDESIGTPLSDRSGSSHSDNTGNGSSRSSKSEHDEPPPPSPGIFDDCSAKTTVPADGPWRHTEDSVIFSPVLTNWRKDDTGQLLRNLVPAKTFYDKVHALAVSMELTDVAQATHPDSATAPGEYPHALVPEAVAPRFIHLWNGMGMISTQDPPGRTVLSLVHDGELLRILHAIPDLALVVGNSSDQTYNTRMLRVLLQLVASHGAGITRTGTVHRYKALATRVIEESS